MLGRVKKIEHILREIRTICQEFTVVGWGCIAKGGTKVVREKHADAGRSKV